MFHDLFIPRDSIKDIDVGFIQVRRREDGRWLRVARTFPASEIPSLAVLHELYGGGEYEVVARCSRNRRVTSRARYSLPGEPKPLGETATSAAKPRKRRKKPRSKLRTKAVLAKRQALALRLIACHTPTNEIVEEAKIPLAEVRKLWQQANTPLVNPVVERENRKVEREQKQMMKEWEREDVQRIRRLRQADQENERAAIVERVLRLREKEALNREKELALVAMGIPVPNAPARSKEEDDLLSQLLSNRSVTKAARGAVNAGGPPNPKPNTMGELADLLEMLRQNPGAGA